MYRTSSLLPYVDGARSSYVIDLLHPWQRSSPGPSSRSPFQIADDSYPFCTLLFADLCTDTGSSVQPLLLVKQKDGYSGRSCQYRQPTNEDMEASWQETYRRLVSKPARPPIHRLAAQTSENEELLPFSPLFFCQLTNASFHPPCPSCGHSLTLCTEDDLLQKHGLAPYRASLERYLCCPDCVGRTADPVFYAFSPSRDHPPCVQDRFELVSAFSSLLEKEPAELDLPCLDCSSLASCFSQGAHGPPPVVPFGFYPFYLLCFERPTLRADDFSALLSGARLDQVAAAHRKRGSWSAAAQLERDALPEHGQWFLHAHGENRFLETLFLKWGLLQEIFERSFSSSRLDASAQPCAGLALSSWWVKLEARLGALPLLWSSSLSHIPLLSEKEEHLLPAQTQAAQRINAFGVLCFSVLVPDQEARLSGLRAAARMAEEGAEASIDWEALFAPQSISLEQGDLSLSTTARQAWRESLGIAGLFWHWSPSQEAASFLEEQRDLVHELVQGLRSALFEIPSAKESTIPSGSQDLLAIMDELIADWPRPQAGKPLHEPPAAKQRTDRKNEEQETLLLNLEPEARDGSDEDTMSIDETRVETVFLSINDPEPSASGDDASAPVGRSGPEAEPEDEPETEPEPDLEKTVFIRREPARQQAGEPQRTDPDATFVQRPTRKDPSRGSERDSGFSAEEAKETGRQEPAEPDDLDKTIIQPVNAKRGERRGRGKG